MLELQTGAPPVQPLPGRSQDGKASQFAGRHPKLIQKISEHNAFLRRAISSKLSTELRSFLRMILDMPKILWYVWSGQMLYNLHYVKHRNTTVTRTEHSLVVPGWSTVPAWELRNAYVSCGAVATASNNDTFIYLNE